MTLAAADWVAVLDAHGLPTMGCLVAGRLEREPAHVGALSPADRALAAQAATAIAEAAAAFDRAAWATAGAQMGGVPPGEVVPDDWPAELRYLSRWLAVDATLLAVTQRSEPAIWVRPPQAAWAPADAAWVPFTTAEADLARVAVAAGADALVACLAQALAADKTGPAAARLGRYLQSKLGAMSEARFMLQQYARRARLAASQEEESSPASAGCSP